MYFDCAEVENVGFFVVLEALLQECFNVKDFQKQN